MIKTILCKFFFVLFMTGLPLASMATSVVETVGNDFQNISISLNDEAVLRVTGASGQMLFLYNITGIRMMSIRVDGPDKSYALNLPKGCYIVKIGKVVRKISIR